MTWWIFAFLENKTYRLHAFKQLLLVPDQLIAWKRLFATSRGMVWRATVLFLATKIDPLEIGAENELCWATPRSWLCAVIKSTSTVRSWGIKYAGKVHLLSCSRFLRSNDAIARCDAWELAGPCCNKKYRSADHNGFPCSWLWSATKTTRSLV